MVVAKQRIACTGERGPHRAAQRRLIGGGAHHELTQHDEPRLEIVLGRGAYTVEQADQCAQPSDPEAAVLHRSDLGLRFAREQRSFDRAERGGELRAHWVGLRREGEHRGQRVVGEQLAIEVAQQPHRMAAIERVVVGGFLEPIGRFGDLFDRGASLAQRGHGVTGVERGARGRDRNADTFIDRRTTELAIERVEQRPAAVIAARRRALDLTARPRVGGGGRIRQQRR